MDAILTLAPTGLGPPRLHRFCFGLLPVSFPHRGRTSRPGTPGNLLGACVSRSSSFAPWSFGPLLQRRYPPSSLLWPLLTSPSLSRRSSPQVRCCFFPFIPSGSTSHVSDGHGASLWPASLPPVRGLSADSCSYGQRFVPRFLQLGRAACAPRLPPCGSLRLPPSVPVSTLQLTRNSPCWAHWRKPPGLPRTDSSVLRSAKSARLGADSDPVSLIIARRQAWSLTPHLARTLRNLTCLFRCRLRQTASVGARLAVQGLADRPRRAAARASLLPALECRAKFSRTLSTVPRTPRRTRARARPGPRAYPRSVSPASRRPRQPCGAP